MPWKQDLSKLKQQLKEDPPGPPPPAPKKVIPPSPLPSSMADEDAVFLSAMGLRPSAPAPRSPLVEPPVRAVVAPPAPEPDFAAAMAGLGGLKPLQAKGPEARPSTPVPPAQVQAPVAVPPVLREPAIHPVDVPTPAPEPSPLVEAPPAGAPLRIQLAAGMAIEVDGHLDLRGHSRGDAIERLRDRLEDARYMHWRSLHVTLGAVPDLHEALQELLQAKGLPLVLRYAQAPIPMGGSQAWILYLTA